MRALSLFAGVGGFDLAAERVGIDVVAHCEIDPAARAVLRRRFPHAHSYDDVRTLTGDRLRADGSLPDIILGGFPCQDLSVAGRRAGLGGERSGLFFDITRLLAETGARWFVLENVPGLLSSTCPCAGGLVRRDGSCLRAARAAARLRKRKHPDTVIPDSISECAGGHGVPDGACIGGCMAVHGGAMGAVLGSLGELGYGVAYRMLDAQHFGVPQRRRRVFFVGCLGDGAAPAQVLLEPEGSTGHPAPGVATGPGVAASAARGATRSVVSSLTASYGGVGADDNQAQAGHLAVVGPLQAQGADGRGHRIDAEGAANGHIVPTVTAKWSKGSGGPAGDETQNLVQQVTHTLTVEGFDASEDGTAAVPIDLRNALRDCGDTGVGTPGTGVGDDGDPSGTISTGSLQAVATYRKSTRAATSEHDETWVEDDKTNTLNTFDNGDTRAVDVVLQPVPRAFHLTQDPISGDVVPAMGAKSTGQGVQTGLSVRRLTPRECERLQGFPDDWTRWDDKGKEIADGPRYRFMGNAVAVPVVQWALQRLVAVASRPEVDP